MKRCIIKLQPKSLRQKNVIELFLVDEPLKEKLSKEELDKLNKKEKKDEEAHFKRFFTRDTVGFFNDYPGEQKNEKSIEKHLRNIFFVATSFLKIINEDFLKEVLEFKSVLEKKNDSVFGVLSILIEMAENFKGKKDVEKVDGKEEIRIYTFDLEKIETCKCFYQYEQNKAISFFNVVMSGDNLAEFNGKVYFKSFYVMLRLLKRMSAAVSILETVKGFKNNNSSYNRQWIKDIHEGINYSANLKYFEKKVLNEEQLSQLSNITLSLIKANAKYRCVPSFSEGKIELFLVPSNEYDNYKKKAFEQLFDLDARELKKMSQRLFDNAVQNKETFFRPFFNKMTEILEPINENLLEDVLMNKKEYPKNDCLIKMAKKYDENKKLKFGKLLIYSDKVEDKIAFGEKYFIKCNYDLEKEKNDTVKLCKMMILYGDFFNPFIEGVDNNYRFFCYFSYYLRPVIFLVLQSLKNLKRIDAKKYKIFDKTISNCWSEIHKDILTYGEKEFNVDYITKADFQQSSMLKIQQSIVNLNRSYKCGIKIEGDTIKLIFTTRWNKDEKKKVLNTILLSDDKYFPSQLRALFVSASDWFINFYDEMIKILEFINSDFLDDLLINKKEIESTKYNDSRILLSMAEEFAKKKQDNQGEDLVLYTFPMDDKNLAPSLSKYNFDIRYYEESFDNEKIISLFQTIMSNVKTFGFFKNKKNQRMPFFKHFYSLVCKLLYPISEEINQQIRYTSLRDNEKYKKCIKDNDEWRKNFKKKLKIK